MDINRRSLELTRSRVEKGDAAVLEQNLIRWKSAVRKRSDRPLSAASQRRVPISPDLPGSNPARLGAVTPPAIPSTIPLRRAGEREPSINGRIFELLRLTTAVRGSRDRAGGSGSRPNLTMSAGYSRVNSSFDDQFGHDGDRRVDTAKRS